MKYKKHGRESDYKEAIKRRAELAGPPGTVRQVGLDSDEGRAIAARLKDSRLFQPDVTLAKKFKRLGSHSPTQRTSRLTALTSLF